MIPRRFRDLLTRSSAVTYLAWRLSGSTRPVTLRLRDGLRLRMRPPGSATDYGVAYEIFVNRTYDTPLLPHTAARVVDLGGNVGYSTLWWAARYPRATIAVYEPVPEHVRILHEQLRLNGLEARVTVRPVAVGAAAGRAVLAVAGARSTVRPDGHGIAVPVVDFFAECAGDPIDILKIDIEGSEHDLLRDGRFGTVPVRLVIMEWHDTAAEPRAGTACASALTGAGFVIESSTDHGDGSGILIARRT